EGVGGNACASRFRKEAFGKETTAGIVPPAVSLFYKLCQETKLLLTDKFGRAVTDLRISVTDRCNYKCVYCRTGNEGAVYGELPFADYLRMAQLLVGMGIRKVRITGGEPLLRNGVVNFVRDLSQLRDVGGDP